MEKKETLAENSASIFEEIEIQLDTLLSEKKQKIQEDLENIIASEKKDAEAKISRLEQEMTEEKDSLYSFKLTMAEYESDKKELKEKIKEHLAKAMEFQPQIESLTAQTFEELKKVMELNKELEEINSAAASKLNSIKQNLEEKYGISAALKEAGESDDVQFNLDGELEKLKKIQELLGQNSVEISDNNDGKHGLNSVIPSEVADQSDEEVIGDDLESAEEEIKSEDGGGEDLEASEESPREMKDVEDTFQIKGIESESEAGMDISEKNMESAAGDIQAEEEKDTESKIEVDYDKPEIPEESSEEVQNFLANLESHRKVKEGDKNIKLSYFENEGNKFLDSKELVDTISKTIAEADGLFDKLTQSDSPKEQFFSKQEILWHQETLREYVQESIEMCEKEKATFPKILDKVFNLDVLRDLHSKLNDENWSNATNFASFKKQMEALKADFIDKSTPEQAFLKSLTEELNLG